MNSPGLTRLLIPLLVITAVSGALLSTVEALTRGPIHNNRQQRLLGSLAAICGDFDNDPLTESWIDPRTGARLYPARRENQLTVLAVEATSEKGYGGEVTILAGIESTGILRAVRVLRHRETPGLGSKLADEAFLHQFPGRAADAFPLRVRQDGGDIDALTAATISSRAFLEALNRAMETAIAALADLHVKEVP